MSFTKMDKNVLNISALPDKVQNQAQTLKATFDQAGVDIKEALNGLINELESKESAGNLGAIKNGAIITLQSYLDSLNDDKQDSEEGKGLSTEDFTTLLKERLESMEDGANKYTLPQATDEILGGIILGTTLAWVNGRVESLSAPAPDEFAREDIRLHKENEEVHVTAEDRVAWDEKADGEHTHTSADMTDLQPKLDGKADTSHNQSADTITAGTLAGKVVANSAAVADVGTYQIRNIAATTGGDLTPGVSSLVTGQICIIYE